MDDSASDKLELGHSGAAEEVTRPRRRVPWWVALVVLLAIALGAWYAWRHHVAAPGIADQMATLDARVDSLTRGATQLRGTLDTLRARLDDGEKVDASVRQQLLALGDRMRLAEDALANVADHRLSGHDALALDEAESLLTLGAERYRLFNDARAAIAAYQLADNTLAGVEDAAFTGVRQTILGEITALDQLQTADPHALVARLRQLRDTVAQWRTPRNSVVKATPAPREGSRLARLLGAFVQVRHDDDGQLQLDLRDGTLARELVELDLREAQAAALARDVSAWRDALDAARAQIAARSGTQWPDADAALREIDALRQAPLAPPPPAALGASLRELRNLRATHALSTAIKPTPAAQAKP